MVFTTPKMYQMFLKSPELDATVKRLLGRPVRITIKVGEVKVGEAEVREATPSEPSSTPYRARPPRGQLAHPGCTALSGIVPG